MPATPLRDPRVEALAELVDVIDRLRDPDGGCPWDLEQTHASLGRHLLEEAYEALEAIEGGSGAELAEELGDVLLQVVLHARIAQDDGMWDLAEVARGITAKLKRRHPHVFADGDAATPSEVTTRWDEIKRDEKAASGLLESIPRSLPALAESMKISKRAVSVGFEWETVEGVWEKLDEEIAELKATAPGTAEAAEEIGDLLFTAVNLARKFGVDAEGALRDTNAKFRRRWASMEAAADASGRDTAGLGIDELEALWQRAKEDEPQGGEPA
jgi:tetrapyrrole methylase family protein/MazG family protein